MASISRVVATLLAVHLICAWAPAHGDELRNLRRGEPVPPYRLVTTDGTLVGGEDYQGSVVVMVYLAAEQRSSELAALDARTVLEEFADEPVELVYFTADVVRRTYFDRFRKDRHLHAPLALDADRSLYSKLGLIVFPTTLVVDREGKLAHVISLHNPDYKHVLDSSIRHALEELDDEELQERLKARPTGVASPQRVAAAHRALARQLREQGRLEASRDELIKAREQDPKNPDILLDLADLDAALNMLEEAEQLVRRVLSENPGHRRAKQIHGIILYRRGQLSEAESMLTEALNLNPEPARIHYYLGRICEQQGRTSEAMEHYRSALQRLLMERESPPPPE